MTALRSFGGARETLAFNYFCTGARMGLQTAVTLESAALLRFYSSIARQCSSAAVVGTQTASLELFDDRS
jgi:hypothetical protein